MTYPDGEVVTYNYNDRMLLNSLIGANTYVSSTNYDAAGRITTRALGNTLTQTYNYYAWNETATVDGQPTGQGGRLKQMTVGSLQNLSYVYDAVGNIRQITNSIASETNSYSYDTLDRLTGWTLNAQSETYTYNLTTGNLASKAGMSLQYNDSAHVHAVTNAGGNTYSHDANGSQTTRVVGADTYNLKYDAENRIVEVKKNNVVIASFTFDGDGKRVKSVMGSDTNLFVGGQYEIKNPGAGQTITKYYFAGVSRIAMRKYTIPVSMAVEYFLGDHLGSTSITTDVNGAKFSEMRYKPWGEVRYSWKAKTSTTPSYRLPNYTFTGQFAYMDDPTTAGVIEGFGLMDYDARMYDPVTGRFISADSIVPSGVHGYDRYNYVNNRPTVNIDPTGHRPVEGEDKKDKPECAREPSDDAKADLDSLPISTDDYMKTYTVANIGLQKGPPPDIKVAVSALLQGGEYVSRGPAKVTDAEMTTPYGIPVPGRPSSAGLGLNMPEGHGPHLDQNNMGAAVIAMSTRIQTRLDMCDITKFACTPTDIFLAAAVGGDNGMAPGDLKDLGNGAKSYGRPDPSTGIFAWSAYLDQHENKTHNSSVIQQFIDNVAYLQDKGAAVPDINWDYICGLVK